MRISMRVVAVALVAGISGWVLRGLQPPPSVAAPARSEPAARPEAHEVPTIPAISAPASQPRRSEGARNLFDYALLAVPAPLQRPVERQLRAPDPLPVHEQALILPELDDRPRFPYRYIERFGPEQRPIAAFVRNGEILTVRAGETIDGTFNLRSIGMESVEVETASLGVRERVPLGR